MTRGDFDHLRALIHSTFGIAMSTAKFPLLRARIQSILRERQIASAEEYISTVLHSANAQALGELADAVTTNHTFFWRESTHFGHLVDKVIPALKAAAKVGRTPSLRIWCAAASTGQEPYTLAALVRGGLGADFARWDSGVLATDLSARALEVARVGRYTAAEAQPLPTAVRRLLLNDVGDGCEVRPEVRADVTLRRLNLLGEFKFRQPFEVIFCRNVMIYFDDKTRMNVTRALAATLRPGGYLYVGLSESLGPAPPGLAAVAPAIYVRTEERL